MGFLERAERLRAISEASVGMAFENRVVAKLLTLSGYKNKVMREADFRWLKSECQVDCIDYFITRKFKTFDKSRILSSLPTTHQWKEFEDSLKDTEAKLSYMFFPVNAKIYVMHNSSRLDDPPGHTMVRHRLTNKIDENLTVSNERQFVTLYTIEAFVQALAISGSPLYAPD